MVNKEQKKNRKKRRIRWISGSVFVFLCLTIFFVLSGFNKKDIEKIEQSVQKIKDTNLRNYYVPSKNEDVNYSGFTVCIDPGHGGKDPGTMNEERAEKDENLKFAMVVKENLEKYGVNVIMTREDDSGPSLKKRAKIANRAEADLFVSLHRNYFSGSEDINGIDIYINCEGSDEDFSIGNAIYDKLSKVDAMKVNNPRRGSATDENENYTVVAKTKMTACLIEMGYLSNKRDNSLFDSHFNEYSIAVAEGIIEHLAKN